MIIKAVDMAEVIALLGSGVGPRARVEGASLAEVVSVRLDS
jgi:hypothetical protein